VPQLGHGRSGSPICGPKARTAGSAIPWLRLRLREPLGSQGRGELLDLDEVFPGWRRPTTAALGRRCRYGGYGAG
jgi:hypothetical protein